MQEDAPATLTAPPVEGQIVQSGHAKAIEEKVKRLSPRHILFLQEYLNNGFKRIEAYYKAGYHPKNRVNASQNASELLENPRISSILSENIKEAVLIIKSASPAAAAKVIETMNSEDSKIKGGTKLAAANSILDRAGINPPEQQKPDQTFNIQINITEKK